MPKTASKAKNTRREEAAQNVFPVHKEKKASFSHLCLTCHVKLEVYYVLN